MEHCYAGLKRSAYLESNIQSSLERLEYVVGSVSIREFSFWNTVSTVQCTFTAVQMSSNMLDYNQFDERSTQNARKCE